MPAIAQSENDFCSWKEMQLVEHQNHETIIISEYLRKNITYQY